MKQNGNARPNEKTISTTVDGQQKILVLKNYCEGEMNWEVNPIPEDILAALLPTDLEIYLDTELRLEYITREELDQMTLNSYQFVEGMNKVAAKEELIKELNTEIDALNARIAKINEVQVTEEEIEEYKEDLEFDKEMESRN